MESVGLADEHPSHDCVGMDCLSREGSSPTHVAFDPRAPRLLW